MRVPAAQKARLASMMASESVRTVKSSALSRKMRVPISRIRMQMLGDLGAVSADQGAGTLGTESRALIRTRHRLH